LNSIAAVALLAFVGCATAQPPAELVAARRAFARASQSPAGRAAPDEVRKAQVALSTAEHSFADSPEGNVTRDLAYIAERKSQLAEAKGQILLSGKDRAAADKEFKQTLSDQKDQAQQQTALS